MKPDKRDKAYIESQARAAAPVTNDDLICKDCRFRNDRFPTSHCDIFKKGDRRKPNAVLLGKECFVYKKKE